MARMPQIPRPDHPRPETSARPLHGQDHTAIGADNAAPVPQSPQLHGLRRIPTEADVRTSVHMCRSLQSYAAHVRQLGSEHFRKSRASWIGALPVRDGGLHRPCGGVRGPREGDENPGESGFKGPKRGARGDQADRPVQLHVCG